MTTSPLPQTGTLVELEHALHDEPIAGVRVVQSDDAVLTLSVALASVPTTGAAVTLRWPAGPRGRYVLTATVVRTGRNRLDVAAAGPVQVQQQRHYVRGGGGEQVRLHRPGRPDSDGWVRDLSEHSLRAHFADADVAASDPVRVQIALDREVIETAAVVSRVAALRQTVPQRGPMSVELIAVFAPDETQAQIIRRYVLRQQLLARVRTGD